MLAKSLIDEIHRLLKLGNLSQRKIAAQLRVSRGTVSAIASGRRGLFGREASDEEPFPHGPQSPPERCVRCGYRVYAPCLVCRSRDFQERQKELQCAAQSLQQLSIDSVERLGQADGETRRQGDDAEMRSPAHLHVSPSPCLLVYSAPPPAGLPVLTFIPAAGCTTA